MNFGYLILFIGLECLLSFALAWWLVRRSKHMSRRKLLLIAPLPVPALIFALGIYVIVNVSSLSREECGVDACGFAIAGIIVAYTASLVAYVLGMAAAEIACRLAGHSE